MAPARRVVTATDSDGRSYFLTDGEADAVLELPGRELVFHELWVAGGPLASDEGTADAAGGAGAVSAGRISLGRSAPE